MTRGFSLYLDAARVLAAFAVLLSHFGYDFVSAGRLAWARELNIGSDAVVIFFVLSGLVIAHTVAAKDRDAGAYALARLSRLWSVAIPAIVFSIALAVLGSEAAPGFYPGITPGELLRTAVRSLGFTNYLWYAGIHLPANNPFWSVTYEFWYYVGLGIATYFRDRSRLYGLVGVALLVGPRILLLLPCWLLGVGVRRFLDRDGFRAIGRAGGWALLLAPVVAYVLLEAVALPATLTRLTSAMVGGLDPNRVFGFSDEFLWNWILALLTAVHFVGAAVVCTQGSEVASAPARAIRWLSARTYSLYLFHTPILVFVATRPGYDAGSVLHPLLLAMVVVAGSFALAEVTERRLSWWRAWLADLAGHGQRLGSRVAAGVRSSG